MARAIASGGLRPIGGRGHLGCPTMAVMLDEVSPRSPRRSPRVRADPSFGSFVARPRSHRESGRFPLADSVFPSAAQPRWGPRSALPLLATRRSPERGLPSEADSHIRHPDPTVALPISLRTGGTCHRVALRPGCLPPGSRDRLADAPLGGGRFVSDSIIARQRRRRAGISPKG